MSEAHPGVDEAGPDPDFDTIANDLYALKPDAFAAARDEQVRQARAARQQPLARELAKLRRPTLSAWLVNLLWRDQRQVMQQLFELAGELSRAQAQSAGAELRGLTAQRREVEAALMRRAHSLAGEAGVTMSDAMAREVQDTLAAALAQPEVADEIRGGRLVKPTAYAGFGPLIASPAPATVVPLIASPAPATLDSEPTLDPQPSTEARQPDTSIVDPRAAERARERREAAENQVQAAREALDTAAEALADRDRAAQTAHHHRKELREQLNALRAQVRELEDQINAAEQAAQAAARDRDQAKHRHAEAFKTLQQAEQEVNQLPG